MSDTSSKYNFVSDGIYIDATGFLATELTIKTVGNGNNVVEIPFYVKVGSKKNDNEQWEDVKRLVKLSLWEGTHGSEAIFKVIRNPESDFKSFKKGLINFKGYVDITSSGGKDDKTYVNYKVLEVHKLSKVLGSAGNPTSDNDNTSDNEVAPNGF